MDWRPYEPSLETTEAAIVSRAVAAIRRPVRLSGDALEVFDVDVSEEMTIDKKLRAALDGVRRPLALIFHTRGDTARLYADFANNFPHSCFYTVEVDFCGKRKFFCDLCGRVF